MKKIILCICITFFLTSCNTQETPSTIVPNTLESSNAENITSNSINESGKIKVDKIKKYTNIEDNL